MKALITGGSGFFGLHLARVLKERGWTVRSVDVVPFPEGEDLEVEFVRGDVTDRAAMAAAVKGMDAVFHCAALVPLTRSGREFVRVNVEGTRTVLTAALEAGVPKAVHVSSSAIYGSPAEAPLTEASALAPLDEYGISKAEAEKAVNDVRAKGLDVAIVRPRTLVGTGRLGILQLLFDWLSLGKRFYILGPGANKFQLLSAYDCATACALAAEKPCRNEDFNVGAEVFGTLREDLEALCRHAGTGARIVSLPAWPAKLALKVLDVLRLSPLVHWHYNSLEVDWYFDVSKTKRVLGWSARDSNADMLASTYDWFVANRERLLRAAPKASAHRRPVVESLLSVLKFLS
jgi:nucleoside-diphosphate-sugar epimerase